MTVERREQDLATPLHGRPQTLEMLSQRSQRVHVGLRWASGDNGGVGRSANRHENMEDSVYWRYRSSANFCVSREAPRGSPRRGTYPNVLGVHGFRQLAPSKTTVHLGAWHCRSCKQRNGRQQSRRKMQHPGFAHFTNGRHMGDNCRRLSAVARTC